MDVDFHFVHDRVVAKTLQVWFCSSIDQLVDIFTMLLVANNLSKLRISLNVIDTPLDLRGCIKLSNTY